MSQSQRYSEDFPTLAADAYEVSGRLCGECRDLHALWPYIRMSRASTGVERRGSSLEEQLAILIEQGLTRVLIAGSADTGLLALVARAACGRPVEIVVLDICETPLELCRRFAKRWSLPIATTRQDLVELTLDQRFDVVLVHGTLQFIAAERRAQVLRRIARALRPGGRLVLMFNTSRPVAGEFARESRAGYAAAVIDELRRIDTHLPEADDVFRERLEAHAKRRELREGAFVDSREIEGLLSETGFRVESCTPVDVELAPPADSLVAKISKRRFMAIAEPKSAS